MTKNAEKNETREVKEKNILDLTLEMFMQSDFNSVKMADVAAGCGYAKGIIFYYFQSKENVFLRLLEREYDKRWAKLTELLSGDSEISFEEFTDILLNEMKDTLDFESPFMRLLGLTNMLENSVTDDAFVEFKKKTMIHAKELIGCIAKRVAGLSADKCLNIFYTENALLSGYNELASIPKQKKAILESADFPEPATDYRKMALQSMQYYLRGIQ